jgi:hypothetical protein
MHERRGAENFQCADEKVDASEKAPDTLLGVLLGSDLFSDSQTTTLQDVPAQKGGIREGGTLIFVPTQNSEEPFFCRFFRSCRIMFFYW